MEFSYERDTDDFRLSIDSTVHTVSPEDMIELVVSAQVAINDRLMETGRMTV